MAQIELNEREKAEIRGGKKVWRLSRCGSEGVRLGFK